VTGVPGFTAHLLRDGKDGGKPDFFGSAPADAKFVSTHVMVDADGDEAKVHGNLTLNGVTKPVTLDVDFYGAGKAPAQMGGKENVGFEAEATIKRSDFGLGYAVPLVSDEVKLEIAAAFQK
jgi:polyisoprenoid-binding protein YceI